MTRVNGVEVAIGKDTTMPKMASFKLSECVGMQRQRMVIFARSIRMRERTEKIRTLADQGMNERDCTYREENSANDTEGRE